MNLRPRWFRSEGWLVSGIIAFGISFAFGISSEPNAYTCRVWETEQGLPHNSVQTILQTRDGYLWVGTQKGLARFDGIRFVTFDSQNTPQLENNWVIALAETTDGSLWIGTDRGGLTRLKSGKFSHFGAKDGLGNDTIRALQPTRDGSLWIGTVNGLVRFHDERFTRFTKADGLPDDIVRGLFEDREGVLWIGTDNGLSRIAKGKIEQMDLQNTVPISLRAIWKDRENDLWVGSNNGLVRLFGKQRMHFNRNNFLSHNIIISLFEDHAGGIWIGTYGGLHRFTRETGMVEIKNGEESFARIYAVYEDREQNIWVGVRDGLVQLRPRRFTSYTQQQGLSHNNAMAVCEQSDGTVWIATWGGGLNRLRDGKITTQSKGFTTELHLALREDHQGALWIGTDYNGGIYRLKNEQLTHFGNPEGLEDAAIRVIYEDSKTNLWIGTSRSLTLFRDGKFTRFTKEQGLSGDVVRTIYEDEEGNLWIGTNEGLSRWENGRFENFTARNGLPAQTVIAIHRDKKKNLWLGTLGGGLCRMRATKTEKQNWTFAAYNTKDGLFSDEVFEILEDDDGYFWMTCRNGVFRAAKKNFDEFDLGKAQLIQCVSFGKSDGMASADCNSVAKPTAWKGRDGRLWFATGRGVCVVNPKENLAPNTVAPPVLVEELFADRQRKILSGPSREEDVFAEKHLLGETLLAIPPGRGELEFHYTALSFRAPEKNRFKYKLEGVDRDWVDAGARRVAFYNNIPPGSYRFRVIACNNDGVWNESGAAIGILLQPHFWQTWWFRISAALVTAALIAGAARYTTKRRMQLQLARLEHQHALTKERERIAQDMHDDIGARLTEILLQTDTASATCDQNKVQSQVTRIGDSVRGIIRDLDAIVWAVNPKNDPLRQLVGYICEYTEMFLRLTSIRYRLDVPSGLPDVPLSSEVRHNVFMVVKEALNNIVKHSGATEVKIAFQMAEGNFCVSIEDNGKGFLTASDKGFGNGLESMKKRITAIGGAFQLCSEPGQGTRVQMQVPLKSEA